MAQQLDDVVKHCLPVREFVATSFKHRRARERATAENLLCAIVNNATAKLFELTRPGDFGRTETWKNALANERGNDAQVPVHVSRCKEVDCRRGGIGE